MSSLKTSAEAAFPYTIPVLFGYIAIGIPFGLMLVQAEYPWWLAPIMSTIIFAGAAQYMAVGLLAAGTPLVGIAAATVLINIRHIVYGLSLTGKFKKAQGWKPYLIFALTDETYALLTGVKPPENVPESEFYGCIALFNQCYWIIGGLIGAIAGEFLPFSFQGVDFALTALFTVLLIEQLRQTRDWLPVLIGIGCAVAALILFGAQNMLIPSLCGALCLLFLMRGRTSCSQ